MAGSVKTEAVVLRTIRYGEADRILHLYTRDRGRVSAMAKGVRRTRTRFGGLEYSKEELIAEIAAGFLCAEAGISAKVIANQAAYLNGWSQSLSRDPKLIVQAASKAQEAADYVLGIPRTQELDPGQPASLKAAEPTQALRAASAFTSPAVNAHPKTPAAPAPRPSAARHAAKPETARPPKHRLRP